MDYQKITNLCDPDIPQLMETLRLPEIARYISIDEGNFWNYITTNPAVSYFKAYRDGKLVGALDCELQGKKLYLSVMVHPEHQTQGFGTQMLQDLLSGKLLSFDTAEAYIEEENAPSVKLFEKMGFVPKFRDGKMMIYTYNKNALT